MSFNAVSFAAVIVALLMMRGVPTRPEESTAKDDVSWRAALEGLRFVFRSPLIRSTMLLDFFATFFSSATALLPIFAQDILKVGATRLRLAVRRARGRRGDDERGDGAADKPHQTPRAGAAVGRRPLRRWRPWRSAFRARSGSHSPVSP